MKNNRYVVIVGCGRVGSYVANKLSHQGISVAVIDIDEVAFNYLSPDYKGLQITGDATLMEVLHEAELDKADVLIATTHDDNVNLLVTEMAREVFKTPRIVARAFDPEKEKAYNLLGIDSISSSSVTAEMFLRAIASTDESTIPLKM